MRLNRYEVAAYSEGEGSAVLDDLGEIICYLGPCVRCGRDTFGDPFDLEPIICAGCWSSDDGDALRAVVGVVDLTRWLR